MQRINQLPGGVLGAGSGDPPAAHHSAGAALGVGDLDGYLAHAVRQIKQVGGRLSKERPFPMTRKCSPSPRGLAEEGPAVGH
jgi:hypothetical protein